jgi:hypothetical protein
LIWTPTRNFCLPKSAAITSEAGGCTRGATFGFELDSVDVPVGAASVEVVDDGDVDDDGAFEDGASDDGASDDGAEEDGAPEVDASDAGPSDDGTAGGEDAGCDVDALVATGSSGETVSAAAIGATAKTADSPAAPAPISRRLSWRGGTGRR